MSCAPSTIATNDGGWIVGTAIHLHYIDVGTVRRLQFRTIRNRARRERKQSACDRDCERNAENVRLHGITLPSYSMAPCANIS
jgi:hypothetical protein